jgi:predicted flavoprotein YhiN
MKCLLTCEHKQHHGLYFAGEILEILMDIQF